MGVVYEAWDPDLGRTIALKVVAPAFGASGSGREAYERRFLVEAKAAARLSHAGIVVVHDVGRDAATGHVYMALEYLTGQTLHERLAEDRLPWREALRIVGRVAEALHHAHSHGVVHRDIKPANIILLPSGEPKILDFGIARVDTGQLTMPGEMFGTPLYMAPEQALGDAVDARSDLFSLGSVAYTLLCGRPAFEGSSVATIVAKIAHRDARPPSETVPGLPGDIDYLIGRAMAKSPADRYAEIRMFADDIEDVLAGRTPRHCSSWTPPDTGGRTIASVAGGGAGLPLLELVEPPTSPGPPALGRRRRGRGTLLLFAALVGAAAAYFHLHRSDVEFWCHELPRLVVAARTYAEKVSLVPLADEAPTRVTVPSAPGPPASMAVRAVGTTAGPLETASAELTLEAAPEQAGPPVAEVVPPASPPAAPLAPSPSASPPVRAASPSVAPPLAPEQGGPQSATSQLMLEVEHQADSGTLEVWVDGARVLNEKLTARVHRRRAIKLDPGRHQIEVRLKSGRNTRTARTSRTFKAGATSWLEVAVARGRAPSLDWR